MDKKASELMGESVIAGVTLEAKKSIIKTVAFGLGGIGGEVLADIAVKPASTPGDHEGIHYAAVGSTKVGFFSMKRGLLKPSLDKLLVEHSRNDVQAVEIKKGVMPAVNFVFRDGTNYVLMCARINLNLHPKCNLGQG
ncbi:hypothetical protein AMJ86_02155 [bacterium SM23_57]|nr:MAG: hypothetical protein AMJ86_02155 [bacterium SM23_57]